MKVFSAEDVAANLPYAHAISVLRQAFLVSHHCPPRSGYVLEEGAPEQGVPGLLGVMPCWNNRFVGVKIATLFPGNPDAGRPAIQASILLLDRQTGAPIALLDGTEVTRRRTAAASVLAATFLARADSERLVMLGSGPQARHIVLAYCAKFPLTSVQIHSRQTRNAVALVVELRTLLPHVTIMVAENLADAVSDADIVSCATSARDPILHNDWISAGTHVDLVGAFRPNTREADSDLMTAGDIYVDTREGVLAEAGDLLIPIQEGRLNAGSIKAELSQLIDGSATGRIHDDSITIFKSVGTAFEDLAAASAVWEAAQRCK